MKDSLNWVETKKVVSVVLFQEDTNRAENCYKERMFSLLSGVNLWSGGTQVLLFLLLVTWDELFSSISPETERYCNTYLTCSTFPVISFLYFMTKLLRNCIFIFSLSLSLWSNIQWVGEEPDCWGEQWGEWMDGRTEGRWKERKRWWLTWQTDIVGNELLQE